MPRKPIVKKTETKTSKKKKEVVETVSIETPNGVVEGIYSSTVYKDGEKISFDIDWDKLKQHVSSIKS